MSTTQTSEQELDNLEKVETATYAQYQKASKALKKFKEKDLTQLVKRYKDNSEELNKQVELYIVDFAQKLYEYYKNISSIVEVTDQLATIFERAQENAPHDIYAFIQSLQQSNQLKIVPESILTEFVREYDRFQREVKDYVTRLRLNDAGIFNHKKITGSFWDNFRKGSGFLKEMIKQTKKYEIARRKDTQTHIELNAQIANRKVQLNFLHLFAKYINSLGVEETILASMKIELQELLVSMYYDDAHLMENILLVFLILKEYPAYQTNEHMRALETQIQQSQNLGTKSMQFAQKDLQRENSLLGNLDQETGLVFQFIQILRTNREKTQKIIQERMNVRFETVSPIRK